MKKFNVFFLSSIFLILITTIVTTNYSNPVCNVSATINSTDCQKLKDIKKRGYLKVGVKVDVARFGFFNPETNKNEGFEPDVARAIAYEVLGNENAIKFIPVTPQTRGPLLDNNELDFLAATFTITEKRQKSYNFTIPYYIDYITFMVNKNSGFNSVNDLNGKNIGVSQSTPTKSSLQNKSKDLGLEFNFSEYTSYHELSTALTTGRIDAISGDKSILIGYKNENNKVLEDKINKQEYALACKLENNDFCYYLSSVIDKLTNNGTIKHLTNKWNIE